MTSRNDAFSWLLRLTVAPAAGLGGVVLLYIGPHVDRVILWSGLYTVCGLALTFLIASAGSAHQAVAKCELETETLEREPRLRLQQHLFGVRAELRTAVVFGGLLVALAAVSASALRSDSLSALRYGTAVYVAGAALWLWVPICLSLLRVSLSSARFLTGVREVARTERLRTEQLRALITARTEIEALAQDGSA